jgi:hypothetical protein
VPGVGAIRGLHRGRAGQICGSPHGAGRDMLAP